MKNIEDKLKEVCAIYKKTSNNSNIILEYEDSIRKFDELVSKGLVKHRGYNLKTIDNIDYHTVAFNVAR